MTHDNNTAGPDPAPAQETFSLADLVDHLWPQLDQQARDAGHTLRLYLDPAVPCDVLGEPRRFSRVIAGLAARALRHRGGLEAPGETQLRIEVKRVEAQRVQIRMSVLGHGFHLSQEEQTRLLQPFNTPDVDIAGAYADTDLGSLRQLLQQTGGDLSLLTRPDGRHSLEGLAWLAVPPPMTPHMSLPLLTGRHGVVVAGRSDAELAADVRGQLERLGAKVIVVEPARAASALAPSDALWVWVRKAPPPSSGREADDALMHQAQVLAPPPARLLVCSLRPPAGGDNQTMSPGEFSAGLITPRRIAKAVRNVLGLAPAEDLQQAHASAAPQVLPTPTSAEERVPGHALLVVEDNPTNQKVIQHQLRLLGHSADYASDGLQGLERWRTGQYALVLTDLHMPGLDGYQMVAAMRREEAATGRPRTPVVAISANAMKGQAEQCLAAGMDDYLAKPVGLPRFGSVLSHWLHRSSAADGRPAATLPTADTAPSWCTLQATAPTQEVVPRAVEVSVLAALVGNKRAVLDRFLADYLRHGSSYQQGALDAVAAGDLGEAGAQAHKLKSSSRSIGALGLGDLCEQIEVAARARRHDIVIELAPQLAMLWRQVATEIEDRLATGSAPDQGASR
ncbi:MAG: response regulator [Rhodoferax sp.]|nr:response regulator [Rhodoferax sp.]